MNETPQKPAKARGSWESHLFLLVCVIACAAFGAWSYYGQLDVVSIAMGEVVPSTQVKTVQHLEGGIVSDILVREGQKVTRGQPLVVLESTASGSDVAELKINVTSLRVDISRLKAEVAEAKAPKFDTDIEADHADLVRQARELFDARRKRLQSRVASQREAIVQRKQDINEITTRIRNERKSLALVNEQIKISEALMREDLTNRYNHLDLLRAASDLSGRIDEDGVALDRSRAAVKAAQAELDGITTSFLADVREELDEKRRNLRELEQRLEKYEDSLKRTTLRSPVDGVVKTLYVATRGGVVRPGETVVEVVPAEDRLVVEARLPIQDIGYVKAGQTARIKLASRDAVRFRAIDGVVTVISPDTIVSDQGYAFYKVRVETEMNHFERGDVRYQLYPGMQVMTSILTGRRSVLEYLLTPLLYSMDSALEER